MTDAHVHGSASSLSATEGGLVRERTMSERIWGIDWQRHLPHRLHSRGVDVRIADFAEISEFAQRHFETLFGNNADDPRFIWRESGSAKSRYYEFAGDFFAFEEQGEIVGVYVGTPIDWSSYYIRSTAILPSHEGLMLPIKMTGYLMECLSQYDVDRIETDVSPGNLTNIHSLSRLRFNMTGLALSERFGALVHFTRHLSEKHEKTFLGQFCQGIHPQLKRSDMDQ